MKPPDVTHLSIWLGKFCLSVKHSCLIRCISAWAITVCIPLTLNEFGNSGDWKNLHN